MNADQDKRPASRRCPFGCGGTLSAMPEFGIGLTRVIKNHEPSCPARPAPRPTATPANDGAPIDKGRAPAARRRKS